jgi:hypothetical protein
MDIHKNARLSFRSREALVQHVVERALTVKAANKWAIPALKLHPVD